jgi:2-C-methyl-D-erythritol 4-phosphate cytidylyltransferase
MASSKSASPPPRPPSAPAVTAVIAAAGSGERLGAGGPKAFVPVAGRPMIEWSIAAFRGCDCVRSIVVAAPPGQDGEVAPGGDLEVVSGGATRAQSVANALEAVETECVAIHDAARPLLTPELVEALVAALDADPEAAGVIAAAPVVDTIKRAVNANLQSSTSEVSDRSLAIERTEDRSQLWAAQTPQVFRTEALREALAAAERPEEATDEAMLVEGAGGTVLIHPVEGQNLKVTTPLDLRVAELLLTERAGA